jgi:hypothetical protein
MESFAHLWAQKVNEMKNDKNLLLDGFKFTIKRSFMSRRKDYQM